MGIMELSILISLLFNGVLHAAAVHPPAESPLALISQTSFFPIPGADKGGFVGLSLINTAAKTSEVAVTWTDGNGNKSQNSALSLAPGQQRAGLITEILGIPEAPADGWIRIDSTESGLKSYMSSGREGAMDGTESSSSLSTTILLPHVSVETGFAELEHTDTLVYLVNPGAATVTGLAQLIGLDGVVVGGYAITIPPRGSRAVRVSEVFADQLPPGHPGGRTFRGYMKVASDSGLAGWLQIDMPLNRRLLRGRGAEEITPARLLMASHFVGGGGALYASELNCINLGKSPITLDLAAQDNRGGRIGKAVQKTLNPGQGLREDVLSLLGVVIPMIYPPPLIEGYIRIRAAGGGTIEVVGDVDITCGNTAASMLSPIGEPSGSDTTLPYAVNDAEYFTGYVIANPNELLTVQTDVTVTVFDRDGHPVGSPRTISMSPSARFAGLVEEKLRGGYLRIRANGPVAALGSIGTWNNSLLAQLPALR